MKDSTCISNTAIIDPRSTIGKNVIIKDFAVVGANAVIGDNCVIGRYCEVRDNVSIGDRTTLGSRCTISENATIGYDCTIKYGFVLTDTPNLESKEKTVGRVGNGVNIGANVTLMPGVIVGDFATLGACSQIRHDVSDGEVWFGNPAKKKI